MGHGALLHHDPSELVGARGQERPQRAGPHRRAVARVRSRGRGLGPRDAGHDAQRGAPGARTRTDIGTLLEQPRDSAGEHSGLPGSPRVQETRQQLPSELRVVAVLAEAMARPRAIGCAPGTEAVGHVGGRGGGRFPLHHEAQRVSQREPEERAGDGIGESGHPTK